MSQQQISIQQLLDCGAHFGHQTRRWNPKMQPYIYAKRNGIHLIDLAKTRQKLLAAADAVAATVAKQQSILFVGTKKQAKSAIKECAQLCSSFYVHARWLGGTLTNLTTIRQSIRKLERNEKRIIAASDELTKKERALLAKQQEKLTRNLEGIRSMRQLPGLVLIVDPKYERIAVKEASHLHIPIMAIVDTNCNPDPITHVIPANDDSLKSILTILRFLAETIAGKKKEIAATLAKEATAEKPLEAL